MPAPKMLSGLPKPVLFGLYGAIGGLLGALVFGELIMLALGPKVATAAPPPPPEPRLALSAPASLQIYQGSTNKVTVQIARDAFEGDVTVHVEGLPKEVTASETVIPANKTEGEFELRAGFSTPAGVEHRLKVIATAAPGGKSFTAEPWPLTLSAFPMPQADIVFVLDVTESMTRQINGLKDGIGTFAKDLHEAKVDARFGCLAFRDLTIGEPSQV
ncbi:MAG TPA: vWA domain-containing protein, partial [Gemmata sp.]